MRYHYHITVECNSDELVTLSKLISSKPTTIDLWKDKKSQTDRMLTKYHRDFNTLKVRAINDIKFLKEIGYDVKRLKIEKEVAELPKSFSDEYKYFEGHIKVNNKDTLENIHGFILSKNPSEKGTKFYNFRVRSENDLQTIKENINKIEDKIEEQYEEVVYDSNQERDRWWG